MKKFEIESKQRLIQAVDTCSLEVQPVEKVAYVYQEAAKALAFITDNVNKPDALTRLDKDRATGNFDSKTLGYMYDAAQEEQQKQEEAYVNEFGKRIKKVVAVAFGETTAMTRVSNKMLSDNNKSIFLSTGVKKVSDSMEYTDAVLNFHPIYADCLWVVRSIKLSDMPLDRAIDVIGDVAELVKRALIFNGNYNGIPAAVATCNGLLASLGMLEELAA